MKQEKPFNRIKEKPCLINLISEAFKKQAALKLTLPKQICLSLYESNLLMITNKLAIRPIKTTDIKHIINYWVKSPDDFLIGMGVDLSKLPSAENLENMLRAQIKTSVQKKQSYALIWLINDQAVGHCNVNQIQFGQSAFMHLHLWQANNRRMGIGHQLVKLSLAHFFDILELKDIFCEPYALNPAPNKTLEKVGFTFIKQYTTVPGSLNFEQLVNRWHITQKDFLKL